VEDASGVDRAVGSLIEPRPKHERRQVEAKPSAGRSPKRTGIAFLAKQWVLGNPLQLVGIEAVREAELAMQVGPRRAVASSPGGCWQSTMARL
jgi:hypothetical protein